MQKRHEVEVLLRVALSILEIRIVVRKTPYPVGHDVANLSEGLVAFQFAIQGILIQLEEALGVLIVLEQVVQPSEKRILEFCLKRPLIYASEGMRCVLLMLYVDHMLLVVWQLRLRPLLGPVSTSLSTCL